MHYAVTGGAGLVGSHLVKYLVTNGHEVTVVDNLSRGSMSNLDDVHSRIKFVNLDIVNYNSLKNTFQGIDGIFHQAALASVPDSFEHEDEYNRTNIVGTNNIFKIGHEFRIKVVFASSSSVYGNTETILIKETSARNPLSPYAVTKYKNELQAVKYIKQGAQIIALRYFNVVGIGRDIKYAGAVPKMLDNIRRNKPPCIFGDGSLIRDFVYVNDVVKANIMAMESPTTHGFFNIGSGTAISIKDLAHMMIKISGKQLTPEYKNPRQGDANASVADISEASKHLKWKPSTSLENAIMMML